MGILRLVAMGSTVLGRFSADEGFAYADVTAGVGGLFGRVQSLFQWIDIGFAFCGGLVMAPNQILVEVLVALGDDGGILCTPDWHIYASFASGKSRLVIGPNMVNPG